MRPFLAFAADAGFNAVWLEARAAGDPVFQRLSAAAREAGLAVVAELRPLARGPFSFSDRKEVRRLSREIRALRKIPAVRHVVLSFRGAPEVHLDLREALALGRNAAAAHVELAERLLRSARGLDGFWLFPSDGSVEDPGAYAAELRARLSRSPAKLGLVWNGGGSPAREISCGASREIFETAGIRPLFLYDAFPWNEPERALVTAFPLGPLRGRPVALRADLSGYAAAALEVGGAERLSLLTVARWLTGAPYEPDTAERSAVDGLAGDDPEARRALAVQADEWGGWVGDPDWVSIGEVTPEALAERVSDPAFAASLDWTVRRYPERIAALAKIRDPIFREDLLRIMERRYRIARAVPLCLEYEARARVGREDALAVLRNLETERGLARRASPDAAGALDRFLVARGVPIGRAGSARNGDPALRPHEELAGREERPEQRPSARGLVDPDRAAVGFDREAAEGQAEPPVPGDPGLSELEPGELLENPLAVGLGNPRPLVGDRNLDPLVARADADDDLPSRRGVLDGVRDQVFHNAVEDGEVGDDRAREVARLDLDRDVPRARGGIEVLRGSADERDRVGGIGLQFQAALLEAGDVEEVEDHPVHPSGGRPAAAGKPPDRLVLRRAFEEVEVREDRGERVLEVVDEGLRERLLERLELLEGEVPGGEPGPGLFELDDQPANPEQGAHLGEELLSSDRLREIVVGSSVEPLHAVRRSVEGGDEHDLRQPRRTVELELSADLDAGDVGHHHVEEDDVGRLRPRRFERGSTVLRRPDRVPRGGQVLLEELPVPGIVVHDEEVPALPVNRFVGHGALSATAR